MAFTKAPTSWLGAGYDLGGSVIGFNTATGGSNVTLPQLTDAEAHPSTGDVRKLYFAMLEAFWQSFNTKLPADRPSRMTIQKQVVADATTGFVTNVYSFTFINEITGQEVAAEPV